MLPHVPTDPSFKVGSLVSSPEAPKLSEKNMCNSPSGAFVPAPEPVSTSGQGWQLVPTGLPSPGLTAGTQVLEATLLIEVNFFFERNCV